MISLRSQYDTCVSLQEKLDQELQESFECESLIDSIDKTYAWEDQLIQTIQGMGYLPAQGILA